MYVFPFASCQREPGTNLVHIGKKNYELKFTLDQDGFMQEFIFLFKNVASILVRYENLWDGSELQYYDKIETFEYSPKNKNQFINNSNLKNLNIHRLALDDGPFYEIISESFEVK